MGSIIIEGILIEEGSNSYLIEVTLPTELNKLQNKFPILYKDGRVFSKILYKNDRNVVKIETEEWFYEKKLLEIKKSESKEESPGQNQPAAVNPQPEVRSHSDEINFQNQDQALLKAFAVKIIKLTDKGLENISSALNIVNQNFSEIKKTLEELKKCL